MHFLLFFNSSVYLVGVYLVGQGSQASVILSLRTIGGCHGKMAVTERNHKMATMHAGTKAKQLCFFKKIIIKVI